MGYEMQSSSGLIRTPAYADDIDACKSCSGSGRYQSSSENYVLLDKECENCDGTGFENGTIRYNLANGATEEQALKEFARSFFHLSQQANHRLYRGESATKVALWLAEQNAALVEELEHYLRTKGEGVLPEQDITW